MKKLLKENIKKILDKEIYYKSEKADFYDKNKYFIFTPQTDDEDYEYYYYLNDTLVEVDVTPTRCYGLDIDYYEISLDVLQKAVEKYKTKIIKFKNEGNNDIIIIPMIDELSRIEKFMKEKFDVKPDLEFYSKFRMDYLKSFLKFTKIMKQLGLEGQFISNEYIMNIPEKEKLLEIKLKLPTEQLKDLLKD